MSAQGGSDGGSARATGWPTALVVGAVLLVGVHALAVVLGRALGQSASGLAVSLGVAVLWGGALALLLRVTARWSSRAHAWTAAVVIALSAVARVAWVATFDAHQISDFGVYLRCGQWPATAQQVDLGAWLQGCRSAYSLDLATYWERALLFTTPLGLLGPLDTRAIETTNVVLLTAASVLVFLFARAVAGARLGLVALALFVSHPELWYAATLASHDVPAVFWLAVALLAQLVAGDERRPLALRAVASVALGLALVALGLQRNWDQPFLLAVGGVGVALLWRAARLARERAERPALRAVGWLVVLQVAAPVAVYGAARWAEAAVLAGRDVGQRGSLLAAIAETDVQGNNTWAATYPWVRYYQPEIPAEERGRVLLRKAAAEFFRDPWQTLSHWGTKNGVLAVPDGYFYFSSLEDPAVSRDTFPTRVERVNAGPRSLQHAALLGWALLTTALLCVRLVLWPARPPSQALGFGLLFAGALLAYLVLLAQVQPRYSLFLVAVAPVLGAEALAWLAGDEEGRVAAPPGGWWRRVGALAVGAAACVGVLLAALALGGVALRSGRWALRDLSGFTVVARSGGGELVRDDAGALVLRLPAEAGAVVRVQRAFACRGCRRVEAFLSDELFPLLRPAPPGAEEEGAAPRFELRADGVVVAEGEVRGVRRLVASLPPGGGEEAVRLELEVSAPGPARAERQVSLRYLVLE